MSLARLRLYELELLWKLIQIDDTLCWQIVFLRLGVATPLPPGVSLSHTPIAGVVTRTAVMKVNLIVTATGTNQGRAIPITGAKFLIGRDADCNLRPASQAISKKHCQVTVREGKVFVQDMGSTNGTIVRGEAITGETEVQSGDSLKVGPLEFKVEISMSSVVQKKTDATPLPDKMKALSTESADKLKAVMAPKLQTTTPRP